MVGYARAALVAALLYQAAHILATPVDLTARAEVDADWVESNFVKCMKGIYPNFPQGSITPDNAAKCHDQSKGHSKRSPTASSSDILLQTRGIETRGLTVTNDPACNSQSLPKNFMIVTDIRDHAQDYCTQMKADLIQSGVGSISPTLANAVTKSADELHGSKSVMLSIVLSAYPPALAAFKTVQGIDTAVVDACTKALTALATKGQGCTADLDWYNAGKAKGETSTGAIGGSIDIASGPDPWFFLQTDFLKPLTG